MALPLKGLRIIDLTKDFAGPFCTMILSDLGAEVIKVERPGSGDETRAWGPPFVKGLSYYFLSLNRGKRSITLDLKTPEAQKIIRELVRDSDILVESFRPGTLAQYNLDYPRLRRVNKALVYCSISGFGQTGPYRDRPGYDLVAFAMSGIMSTTGEEERTLTSRSTTRSFPGSVILQPTISRPEKNPREWVQHTPASFPTKPSTANPASRSYQPR